MEGMTLRPKRYRVLVFSILPGVIAAGAMWLLILWRDGNPGAGIIAFLVAWCGGTLLVLGHHVDRGTISIWERTIVGPGQLFAGRVTVSVDRAVDGELLRATLFDRLNGVCWLQTSAGRIRINRLWYSRADLEQFVRAVESAMSRSHD